MIPFLSEFHSESLKIMCLHHYRIYHNKINIYRILSLKNHTDIINYLKVL